MGLPGFSSTFAFPKVYIEGLYVPTRFLLVKLFFARLVSEQRKGCFEPGSSGPKPERMCPSYPTAPI